MTYELWDLDSGNRVAHFRTEAGAARHLLVLLQEFGAIGLERLALGEYDPVRERSRRLATGKQLEQWAEERIAAAVRRTQAPARGSSRSRQKEPV